MDTRNFFKRAKSTWLILLFFYFTGQSQTLTHYFSYTPKCIEAQSYISLLKLDKAKEILNSEKIKYPGNVTIDYLQNYIDFYTLISTQDAAELKRLKPQYDSRIGRLKKCNVSNPHTLYAQAEIHLQWAFSHILQNEFATAAMQFRSAYKALEENMVLHPNFELNKKDMGMLKAILGTIPDNFKWVLNIVGMKGDFKEGMQMLENSLLQKDWPQEHLLDKQSGQYYYILLQLNLGDKTTCWEFCEKYTRDYKTNLLSAYLRGFTAIKTGRSHEAIQAIAARPQTDDYIQFPIMDYLHGVALLNSLNPNAAIHFKKYVTFSKGQNLIKDAYKRLYWLNLIEDNIQQSLIYKKMALSNGAMVSDEDKHAYKECSSPILQNNILLKLRLLSDGGYYVQANELLNKFSLTNFASLEQKEEFLYRSARIHHLSGNIPRAIEFYGKIVNITQVQNAYYPAMSSLQLGVIYEQLAQPQLAVSYYQKVLGFKNYDYRNSVSQKAKAGLSRLKQ
jgi:hypothetical protein